ncbi:MAG: DEAD/DEAH box helicase [Ignavibacteriaceae bacterium]|nr:DEAD/DEAH box helicase [Ignavibacteriaceae bacterium]
MVSKFLSFVKEKLSELSGKSSKAKETKSGKPVSADNAFEHKVRRSTKPESNYKPGNRKTSSNYPAKNRPNKAGADAEKKNANAPRGNNFRTKEPFRKEKEVVKAKEAVKAKAPVKAPVKAKEPAKVKEFDREVKKVPDNWDVSSFVVPVQEGKMRFHDLNLPVEIMHAIYDLKFQYCTPIQKEILSSALEGRDATGKAQTGTGKTAAFLISIFTKFLKDPPQGKMQPGRPRALIIAPTRELVIQIANDAKLLAKYTSINITEIFGGMDFRKQKSKLNRGPSDIIVATPGRLIDFMNKHDISLSGVEILVIDEADRMLDMGFIPDVRRIVHSTPPKAKRQTLFFSATLSSMVERLAVQWTKDAINVEIDSQMKAGDMIEQLVYIVTNDEKFPLLYNLITGQNLHRVMIFTNRKDETRVVEELLLKYGIDCKVLSGDIDQRVRLRTLDDFKAGKIKVLVATDVAGRGIHIADVSHVINYTLPEDPEDYVHRIGRTGRAGASGISISFASEDDSFQIPAIEKFLGNKLECTFPPEELLLPLPEVKPRVIETTEK